MVAGGTTQAALDLLAPGSRVVVRDLEWQVTEVERHAMGTRAVVHCVGRSELVRDQEATFLSDLDRIEPEDPTVTKFRLDESPHGLETRLVIESLMRRTPEGISDPALVAGHRALADDLPFQREPFRVASAQLQPRLLIADAVGLGKTIEVGIMLAELQRRGRANRVLAVVPRHILDQVQHELWCRFGFPLVRLDSAGIQRVRQQIPDGTNPFLYFNRVIVSIDTLKNPSRYLPHLERVRWDVVWIDESHKLVNRSTLNNKLAKVLAPNADSLILSSATPHNGRPESFAELVGLLDPTAVADPENVTADDIGHLVVRRHRHSPDVEPFVGHHWAERAEPQTLAVVPSPAEEAVFAELSSVWLSATEGVAPPCDDALFPYTLLKAALSSPVALAETVDNRLKRTDLSTAERTALGRLADLAATAHAEGSAKLDRLVETVRDIGVGPRSDVRVVVFSERVRSLYWIAEAIRERLGMTDEQVVTFHNAKSDDEQQRIVEDFSMASAAIRVLVSSDIASEGVNLHKQCHHMIVADLPFSLIVTAQRAGRIDRYGQLHSPQVFYLLYTPEDPGIASDVRVLSKLIAKEHAAHRALGDAASVMRCFSESAEESKIIEALRARNEASAEAMLDEVAPEPEGFDAWRFLGLDGGGPVTAPSLDPPPTRELPTLFGSDADFLTAAIDLTYPDQTALEWEADATILSFRPPEDLLRRLSVLPQSYLRQRDLANRLRLTSDEATAQEALSAAVNTKAATGETGTAWPEVHYLTGLHPVLDWAADKVLYRVGRNEAVALACDVDTPTVLVSAVWANARGEPIVSKWLAVSLENDLALVEDMFAALGRAGVGPGMVNTAATTSLDELEDLLRRAVAAATSEVSDLVLDTLAVTEDRLNATRQRLEAWQAAARGVAGSMKSDVHRKRRLDDIERITRQVEALIDDHTPVDAPLIRIVAALVPRS